MSDSEMRERLTAFGGFGVVIDHGQIGGEEVHNRCVDLRFQGLPLDIVVLFAHRDEVRTQEDRLHPLDSKQLPKKNCQ